MLTRADVCTVTCPVCKAGPERACVSPKGKILVSCHQHRWKVKRAEHMINKAKSPKRAQSTTSSIKKKPIIKIRNRRNLTHNERGGVKIAQQGHFTQAIDDIF